MKQKLTKTVTRTATFTREGEEVTYTLHPLPIGYTEHLQRVYPAPVRVTSEGPVVDPDKRPDWMVDVNLMCIARSLGDEMSTPVPTASTREEWSAYAAAIRAEFAASGLVEGEIATLATELNRCQRGLAATGKA